MDLEAFLLWIVTPGAGIIALWIAAKVKAISELPDDTERLVTAAIAAAIGIVGYLAQVGMLYAPAPENWREWVEAIFSVAFIAAGLSDVIRRIGSGVRTLMRRLRG